MNYEWSTDMYTYELWIQINWTMVECSMVESSIAMFINEQTGTTNKWRDELKNLKWIKIYKFKRVNDVING